MIVNSNYDDCDVLIVGAGLFGITCARILADNGFKCLIVEERYHIGGNCYDYVDEETGINIHKYGAHIFHSDNQHVWDWVNRFTKFNNFINRPIANYEGKIYNLPFNMNTFCRIFDNVRYPDDAVRVINDDIPDYIDVDNPKNLEEKAMSMVGEKIYKILVKDYTEKQWKKDCKDLDPSIIRRLPVRFTYDNNYFNCRYQGVPINGYTDMFMNMLDHENITVMFDQPPVLIDEIKNSDKQIIYTGRLDRLFNYEFGILDYRGVKFKTEKHDISNYQGNAVVNYTGHEVDYTRVIEHKFFETNDPNKIGDGSTVISYEFPTEDSRSIDDSGCYPINDERNTNLYNMYLDRLSNLNKNIHVGGRLGMYKYFDMSDAISEAFIVSENVLNSMEGK